MTMHKLGTVSMRRNISKNSAMRLIPYTLYEYKESG